MKLPTNKIILLVLSVLLYSLSFAQKVKEPVVINGTLGDKGTYKQIYLDTLNGQNPWIFTSSMIDENGGFTLVAPITETEILRLRLDDKNYIMMILTPGEKITFKTNGSKLGTDAYVTGSVNTQLLYNTLNNYQMFDKNRAELNKQYADAQISPMRDSLNTAIIGQLRSNDSLQRQYLTSQMEKRPSSLAWVFFTDKLDMSKDYDIIRKIDAAMMKEYPDNSFVTVRHKAVELEGKTAIGATAPDIALPDPEGNIRKLSSLKGKIVLIDFWASWCGPCRKENPNVVNIYNKYHDKGFEVFSVSLDKDKTSWLNAIAKDNLSWPNHVSDLKYWSSAGAQAYGVNSIPCTFLLDKKGRIVAKRLRGEELENKVKELCE